MNQINPSLSRRGNKSVGSQLRIDLEVFYEAIQNIYHPRKNPTGTFPLNIAENVLTWPILKKKIKQLVQDHEIPDWVAGYTDLAGHPEVREVFAEFISIYLTRSPVTANQIALSAGATSVIELTSWILGEPGDVAVFPAPAYPTYRQDIQLKAGIERKDLPINLELESAHSGYPLSIHHLQRTWQELQSANKRFRFLILTHPDNPTGMIYSENQLEVISQWCLEHKVHLIVNEIYGLSLIREIPIENHHRQEEFHSFAKIMVNKRSDYLHMWYALSKDFGVSGFRVGLLYSHNTNLLAAYGNLNGPGMVSNFTQWICKLLLKDHTFLEMYISENQNRISASYYFVANRLEELKIPYVKALGSLFVWLDLSEFLVGDSLKEENELWMSIYEEAGILLTPGEGFGHVKKGWFRLVHTCIPSVHLEVAMDRIGRYVINKRMSATS